MKFGRNSRLNSHYIRIYPEPEKYLKKSTGYERSFAIRFINPHIESSKHKFIFAQHQMWIWLHLYVCCIGWLLCAHMMYVCASYLSRRRPVSSHPAPFDNHEHNGVLRARLTLCKSTIQTHTHTHTHTWSCMIFYWMEIGKAKEGMKRINRLTQHNNDSRWLEWVQELYYMCWLPPSVL